MTDVLPRADRSSPRELWDHEALGFTPWLAEHIEELSEVIDRELAVQDTERATPTGFALDLFIEDVATGETGAIEAQLEKSDHKHLGQLLTYVTAFDADFAVWIVHGARYEHRRAIEWVNESSDKTAYLVNIEAVTIRAAEGDDADEGAVAGPAPLFTLLSGPSMEAREIGETKRERSERNELQYRFHEGVKERLPASFHLFDNVAPKHRQYISAGGGFSGISYSFQITDEGGYAQLFINVGDEKDNNAVFDQLNADQETIEEEIGQELVWKRMTGSKACRIHTQSTETGLQEQEHWADAQEQLADVMPSFFAAFDERLQAIL